MCGAGGIGTACGGIASSWEKEDGDDPWEGGASTEVGSFVFTFERKRVGSIGKTGKLGRSSRRFRRFRRLSSLSSFSGTGCCRRYRDGGQVQGSKIVEWESD